MINKVYDKVLTFIKEDYKFIIFCCVILFLGFFHLPYNIYVGGGIINLENRVSVDNEKPISGSLNLVYVKSLHATIPTYLLSYVFDWERESIDVSKIDDEDTAESIWKRELLYLQEANDNAILSSFKEANENIYINKELLKVLYIDSIADTDLEIGDILLKINNIELKEYNDIKNIIQEYNVGDKLSVNYLRDNKEKTGYFILKELDNKKIAGLYLIKLFDYKINRQVDFKFKNSEGGPSGGLMTALSIYSKLKGDVTHNKKIVGTGTIDKDGNVGEIGGIKYKLKGAVDNDADIFLVPEGNYEEALRIKDTKKYNIDIVKVKTLKEAIDYLESR